MNESVPPTLSNESRGAVSNPTAAQLQSQNQFLMELFRLSARLAELEPSTFAENAVRMIVETIPGVDASELWLYDRVAKNVRLEAAHESPDAPPLDPSLQEQLSLRLREGTVNAALASGQPILLPDAGAFQRTMIALGQPNGSFRASQADRPGLRVVCLPLYIGSVPVGALELFDIGSDANVHEDDLPLLQAFADQLAVVVRNAQIYAEMSAQHRRLQAFDAVVTAITKAPDVEQMLEQALSVTLYVVGSQSGMIALIDGAGAWVAVSYQWADESFAPGAQFDLEGSLLAEVVGSAQPALQAVEPGHRWAGQLPPEIHILGLLPLLSGSRVVGVLVMGFEGPPDARLDWSSLTAIGNQIGIAVANHQLYNASQRERRQLAGVIASIAEGVIICDRSGSLLLSNYAAETLLGRRLHVGMSTEELVRVLDMRTLGGEPLALAEMPLARSLRGEVYQNYEVRITRDPDDERVISCSGAPLITDDGTLDGAVVVFRDMTAYKQHEALRDEFVAVAAHELRAPLAAVKGYVDLLTQREMQRPDATERDRKGIAMLSRQIEHLVRLVDNLLDVSRLDAGRLELYLQPVDLINLIDASIDRISMGDSNHTFVFNGPPTLPIVCDQLRIQQVLTNLLSNAARYSPAGTQITVEVWTESCAIEGGAVVQGSGSESCVVVAVRDQGVGMTPEVQARAFERYYRANTATAASGLGLGVYISREIVARHGGLIWVESAPGQGSTFYIMLPLNREPTG